MDLPARKRYIALDARLKQMTCCHDNRIEEPKTQA
jgi:hypothetical protein